MTRKHKAWWKAGLTVALATLLVAALESLQLSEPRSRLSWGLLLTVASLALIGYAVQGVGLGVVAGILVGLHPRLFDNELLEKHVALADTCVFLTVALVLLAWRQAQSPRFVWWQWLLLFVGLACSVGFAWRLGRLTGLEAAVGVFVQLGIVAPVIRLLGGFRSTWPNLLTLTALGFLAPVAGFGIAQDYATFQADYWQTPEWSVVAANWRTSLESTFIASWWAVTPFLLWGWWRSVRRGWRQESRGEAPSAWTVSCFTLLACLAPFFSPSPSRTFPAIMVWCIFLLTFLVFDILQAVGERLVLRPPEPQQGQV